ncbi:hypothetical protein EWU23_07205 [Cytophagaceae bacterium 50C-KIRBA]|uniref:DUF922 domain-containing protein n=1 Tax=Aquirufa beregesia TaxID=2516556 RepID=A0ABX0EUN6_9BACT|nr:hypothetical protein [Aquirufa beregesia]
MFTTIWAKSSHKKHLWLGAFYFLSTFSLLGQIPTYQFQTLSGVNPTAHPYIQKHLFGHQIAADFNLQVQLKTFDFPSKDSFKFQAEIYVDRDSILGPQLLYTYKSHFKTQGFKTKSGHWEEMAKLSSQSLKSQFAIWWKNNWDKDPKLIQEVRVEFLPDYAPKSVDEDTVFFGQKKLDWTDFKAKPYPGSRFAAQIFSNFEYHAIPRIERGILYLPIQVKVYMLRSFSWKKENLPDRALDHESTHFKITQQAANQFKDQIKQQKLRPLWYESELQWWFLDAYRWMNSTQKNYDEATQHGINLMEQEQWNGKFK